MLQRDALSRLPVEENGYLRSVVDFFFFFLNHIRSKKWREVMLIILGKAVSFTLGASAALKLFISETQDMDNGRQRKRCLSYVTEDGKLDIVLPDRLHGLWVKYIRTLPVHVSHCLDFTAADGGVSVFLCPMRLWESMWPALSPEREI